MSLAQLTKTAKFKVFAVWTVVLIALDRMGASPQRLDEWYETYRDAHAVPPIAGQ